MVEWKKLGEVANLVRGKVISKDFIRDNAGIYPVYSSQTANDGVLGYIDSYMFDGDFLTWTTDGAYAGTIFRRKGRFNITNVCGLMDITDQRLLQDYLYYWLSLIAKSYVQEGMGNPKLMSNVASTILIPIPSLSEQSRIVSILDTFTSSISNLKQQIEERRKQYEYERDLLLDLEGKEGVEMKKLGEICDTLSGFPFDSSQFSETGIRLMRGMNVKRGYFDFSKENNKYWLCSEGLEKYLLESNDIIISMDGSLVGRSFCYLTKEHLPLLLVQRVARIRTKENSKYIYFYISQKFPDYVDKKKTAGAIPHISMKDINSFVIPLPSKTTQSRIVSILDTFEQSISNLEEQLAMREKQYEYYRNQLLTFEGEEERGKT